MKRPLALCLALLLVFALAGCTQRKQFDAPAYPDGAVAELTVYAFDAESEKVFGLINLGHAFVSVKNTSDAPLAVGAYTLPAGEECTFGTWGMNAHWGIWYNVEATYMTLGRYMGRVSMSQGLVQADLARINEYLLGADTWTPFKNCSYFAVDVWNLASDKAERIDLGGLITPSRVAARVRRTVGYVTDRAVIDFGTVGYRDDSAQNELVPFTLRDAA